MTEKPKGASVVSVFGPKGTISGSNARVRPVSCVHAKWLILFSDK